ncbi:MAG: ribbon-helix-helix protein, CopG family [Nitrospirae bacterium]|nr:ribbon-helix-helix protein, CopG family [Nitrospirota bacterium]
MKVKTSITISEELIKSIDELFSEQKNRSEFIEEAVRDFIKRQTERKRDLEDLNILNKKADKLNREAEDVLSYQVNL